MTLKARRVDLGRTAPLRRGLFLCKLSHEGPAPTYDPCGESRARACVSRLQPVVSRRGPQPPRLTDSVCLKRVGDRHNNCRSKDARCRAPHQARSANARGRDRSGTPPITDLVGAVGKHEPFRFSERIGCQFQQMTAWGDSLKCEKSQHGNCSATLPLDHTSPGGGSFPAYVRDADNFRDHAGSG
jgi:hypothetical protein